MKALDIDVTNIYLKNYKFILCMKKGMHDNINVIF